MLGLIICVPIGAILIGLSVVMLTGRGSFLIAGYNTMPESKKAEYDAAALCKFIGKILLPIGVLIVLSGIEYLAEIWWFWVIFTVITLGLPVFTVVYLNTGNRFKK